VRYYIPISGKGKIAVRLGMHRELKDSLPEFMKNRLIPISNWVSRNKVRVKLRLKKLK
jgi:hypothetical protein